MEVHYESETRHPTPWIDVYAEFTDVSGAVRPTVQVAETGPVWKHGKGEYRQSHEARQSDVGVVGSTQGWKRRRRERNSGALYVFRTVHRPQHHVRSCEQPAETG